MQQRAEVFNLLLRERAGFEAKRQRIWIRRNADGRNLQQLLLGIAPTPEISGPSIFPLQRNETDAHRVQEFSFVKIVSNFRDWVRLRRKLDALKQDLAIRHCANLRDQCAANRVNDIAVLMRVLENRILHVIVQLPTGGDDNFVVTIEGFVTHDEVEGRRGSRVGCGRGLSVEGRGIRIGWLPNFNLNFAAQTGLAVAKRNDTVPEQGREFWIVCWSVSLSVHKRNGVLE